MLCWGFGQAQPAQDLRPWFDNWFGPSAERLAGRQVFDSLGDHLREKLQKIGAVAKDLASITNVGAKDVKMALANQVAGEALTPLCWSSPE